jgi:hypothetical protein
MSDSVKTEKRVSRDTPISCGTLENNKNNNNDDEDDDAHDGNKVMPSQDMNVVLKQLVCKSLRNELHWTDLPVDLQDDRDVVLTGLRRHMFSWCDLPPKWKNNVAVVCAAFEIQRQTHTPDYCGYGKQVYDCNDDVDNLSSSSSNPSSTPYYGRRSTSIQWQDLPYHLMTN